MLQLRTSQPTLFESLFNDLFVFPSTETKQPIHDIIENDNEYVVNFYLAGIKKEDVTIDTENDTLTIKAERKEIKDVKYNRKESFTGIYQKSFSLTESVDKDNIDASFVDGILSIKIPKIKVIPKLSKSQIIIK